VALLGLHAMDQLMSVATLDGLLILEDVLQEEMLGD